ncbi:hypothetical protein [Desulfuribacillus alkaliarsenatis]|uniref:Uncharacterized protein n=1 Tax=Desulfuribacillus alkaliarsenatis TaxID=766136 RepID=A0A1E5FZF8_9FIRM|nr:hypothetical protein [Desulfuribacillus alkaliarsenatis]OEF95975.1 hypothetical protein BHF68_09490 [Desulfuribacillus alkaliarsenatis]
MRQNKFLLFLSLVSMALVVNLIAFIINLKLYKGIIITANLGLIIPIIVFHTRYIYQLYKTNTLLSGHKDIRMILGYIIVPVILLITMPSHTYYEGKEIISNKYSSNIEFVNYSTGKSTVPVVGEHQKIYLNNRFYYYSINIESEEKTLHYMVNPVNGKAIEVEIYWDF